MSLQYEKGYTSVPEEAYYLGTKFIDMYYLWTTKLHIALLNTKFTGFPGGSVVKNLPAKAGDMGSIPGSGRSPEEGNGNPLQYSYWQIRWSEEPGGYSP